MFTNTLSNKTDLADDIDPGPLPEDFLEKCFACAAGPNIERFSITTALQKLLTLDSQTGMMFRIDIRTAIDPEFENWLFELATCLKVDHTRIVLLVYAADVMRHRAQVTRLTATLKRGGFRFGMLNVDYDSNHLEAATNVGASIVRVTPEIVDEVVESKTKFETRPIGGATRESAKLRDFLAGFHERSIETVVFSPYRESIPELVVLNATQLRATYIQTPAGMIESSAVD